VVWDKQAETCANYLNKGRLVAVDGRMQVRSYDAQDGSRRWVTEVVAQDVRFLDWGRQSDQEGDSQKTVTQSDDFFIDDVPF
jgi:single-strand DNA-binding protein